MASAENDGARAGVRRLDKALDLDCAGCGQRDRTVHAADRAARAAGQSAPRNSRLLNQVAIHADLDGAAAGAGGGVARLDAPHAASGPVGASDLQVPGFRRLDEDAARSTVVLSLQLVRADAN